MAMVGGQPVSGRRRVEVQEGSHLRGSRRRRWPACTCGAAPNSTVRLPGACAREGTDARRLEPRVAAGPSSSTASRTRLSNACS